MISTLLKKHNFDPVFDSQKVFRLLLQAMSNPARVVNIKEYADKLSGDNTAFLAVAITLLDNETSFNTCENHLLEQEIASLTLAKREEIAYADFVFVWGQSDIKSVIKNAKCGTLADPHKSATVIIQNDGDAACALSLCGPGINGHIAVMVSQRVAEALALRNAQYYEYPQGIDLIFVSNGGELLAIPRLVNQTEVR
ncbi:MAG: phosphonate C-P lyase system protein PhnH [Clostridiales bacterium]|nr:phosphonate C-P lyase system protein PhnH [Clostridiales bacterium]